MHRFANPTQFMRIANAIYPFAAGLCVILFAAALPLALKFSPPDYQQGDTVRIMYVHVASAWLMLIIYGIIAVNSAMYLIWRHPMASLAARASAPVGAIFAGLTLATGMLWGKPMWGTYWVWDGRLTSTLVLFFLYLGYLALSDAFEDQERGDKAAAILALVGSINIPIIKWSVEWWATLHQPSIVSMSGLSIGAGMRLPLFLMAGAFTAYYLIILVLRLRSELLAAKIRNARLSQVAGASAPQPAE